MKVYVGADHRGFHLKQDVVDYLKVRHIDVVDQGDDKLDPEDDFTVFASRVVNGMKGSEDSDARGILICGSGQGMIMAANRYKGIRAGLGWSVDAAKSIRNDENSNVLALPAELFERNSSSWQEVVDAWFNTPFAKADRYVRRIRQLDEMF